MKLNEYLISATEDKYYSCVLKNGLTILLMPRPQFRTTFGAIAVKFGSNMIEFVSKDGSMKKFPLGIAHFLEHKLFESHNGLSPDDLFAQYGADYNAYTSDEITEYDFSTTEGAIECVEILLNFVQKPSFSKKGIDKEKTIIEQEILMYEDRVGNVFHNETLNALYSFHPVKNDIGGKVKDIMAITKDDLVTCYKSFYHPKNSILVVVGNFELESMLSRIEENQKSKRFGKYQPVILQEYDEPLTPKTKLSVIKWPIPMPMSRVALKLPFKKMTNVEENKVDFALKYWLMVSFSSMYETHNDLFNRGIINNEITRSVVIGNDYSHLYLSAQTDRYLEFEEEVIKKLRSLKTAEVDVEAFDLYKKGVISLYYQCFDSNEFLENEIMGTALSDDHFSNLFTDLDNISIEDCKAVQHVFDEEYMTVVRVLPHNETD